MLPLAQLQSGWNFDASMLKWLLLWAQYVRCPISTLCVGQAASMASLLLAAGEPGQRRSLPHARIMVHQPHGGAQVRRRAGYARTV